MARDTDFDPFGDDFDSEEIDDEITDLDELYEFEDWDYEDLHDYEYHGTGDTGGG